MEMPPLSQCSPWLCMNVLSLSDKVIFCEETEKGMIELFNDQGESGSHIRLREPALSPPGTGVVGSRGAWGGCSVVFAVGLISLYGCSLAALRSLAGFDTITLPFRNVFEFGGSFHCVTTDIRRRGQMKSYFKALDAAEAAAKKA